MLVGVSVEEKSRAHRGVEPLTGVRLHRPAQARLVDAIRGRRESLILAEMLLVSRRRACRGIVVGWGQRAGGPGRAEGLGGVDEG